MNRPVTLEKLKTVVLYHVIFWKHTRKKCQRERRITNTLMTTELQKQEFSILVTEQILVSINGAFQGEGNIQHELEVTTHN